MQLQLDLLRSHLSKATHTQEGMIHANGDCRDGGASDAFCNQMCCLKLYVWIVSCLQKPEAVS